MHGKSKFISIRLKLSLIYFTLILLTALIIYILSSVHVGFLFATVIAIITAGFLGYLFTKKISKNLNKLMDETTKMLDGNFDKPIRVESFDEIETLSEMLDSLRAQLNDTVTEVYNDKNKLETILMYMADGLIVVDLAGQIIHANPSAKEMLKISDTDIERRHFNSIILKYNEDLVLDNIMAKTEKGPIKETFLYGGTTYEFRCDRFKDENGNDKGVIIFLQDITERQKLEDMQVDFIANISHELKTPLTTVKSYTETLLDGDLESPETSREFLSIIDSEVDRMDRLVKDLLQLSRLDYKQQKWYKKEGDLVSLVKTAVKKMEMTAKSKEQQMNILFDEEMTLLVDMDRDRIEQVVLNILSNAIKYTKDKGRIDIDIIKFPDNVKITIADNGMGIPEKELSRVFERFFRVDKARSRMMGGTGLGLAISKQIIEEHKGDIDIESKFGRGTKITITLPLVPLRGRPNIE